MLSRRQLLKSSAVGATMGTGMLLGTSSASAEGASFGDGVNLQPSYFCSGDQDLGWDLMNRQSGIQSVRIEIEPFSFGEVSTTREDAKRWIDEAARNGYQVIATYHHYPDNGSDQNAALQNAADFWAEHYEYLSRDTDIVVNMMNEWGDHGVSASQYATAYDQALDTLRTQTSYDGPVVCDAPGWGQGTHRLAEAAGNIDDDDLILSAHVYGDGYNATTGQNLQPSHLDVMDETEYPCMVGEFGTHRDGPVDVSAVIEHAKDLGWPVFAWAWNGDGSEDPMNMSDPYWGNDCGADTYTTSAYFDEVYPFLTGGAEQTTTTTEPTTTTAAGTPGRVGGNANLPNDPDSDGLYEDVNGNGRQDIADAVDLFQNQDSVEPAHFDFNDSGEMEIGDAVELFRENTG